MKISTSQPLFPPQTPQTKSKPQSFQRLLLSHGLRTQRSLPASPSRSSLRTSAQTPGPRKVVSFKLPAKPEDLQWKKELISEFNLEIPKKFDYKVSYVRPIRELETNQEHVTTADFWPFRQKLQFVKSHNLGPLLRRKNERNPMYELRLIARLSQPGQPFQMDTRTGRYLQEKKSVRDIKLMNNNEDPWGYIRPTALVYNPTRPTINEWAKHTMYRPASSLETRLRLGKNREREEKLAAFLEAIDITEQRKTVGR